MCGPFPAARSTIQPEKHARKRLPENYLLAAKAWEMDTSNNASLKAIAILQKGMIDLGPLYVFYDEMVTIFMKYKLFVGSLPYKNI